jgi:hypothetical protein
MASAAMVYYLWVAAGARFNGAERSRPILAPVENVSAPELLQEPTRANWVGASTALAAIFEFSDLECPYCRRHSEVTFPQLKEGFVDSGKVLYVFKHFPIGELHPAARSEAIIVECSGKQGAFWEALRFAFASPAASQSSVWQQSWGAPFDRQAFASCLLNEDFIVSGDINDGLASGVRSTPSFIIALRTVRGTWAPRKLVRGARSHDEIVAAVNDVLASSLVNDRTEPQ